MEEWEERNGDGRGGMGVLCGLSEQREEGVKAREVYMEVNWSNRFQRVRSFDYIEAIDP